MASRSASLAAQAATVEPTPKAGPEHTRLSAFVGKWIAEGRTQAGPSGPGQIMTHQHTYGWLPGGFHLFHRWDGLIGTHESKGIEIIGYDPASQSYPCHFFDSDGWARVYQGTVSDRVWTMAGERERCRIEFGDGGHTMTTHWDRSSDGVRWYPLCDVRMRKVSL